MANQALRNKGISPIEKEDTVIWEVPMFACTKVMFFYATPACRWIPAIATAAATRLKRIEEQVGRVQARELFKPPFMVVVMGHSDVAIMMVPEVVRDLQPPEYLLGPVLAEAAGLIPMRLPHTVSS
jgi:hypothetical protein